MHTKSLQSLARVAFSVNTLVFRVTYLKEREKNKRKRKKNPERPPVLLRFNQ